LPAKPKRRAKNPPPKRREPMGSTLRCLKALELLADDPFELSLSEICGRMGLPKASAHRLMATLIEGGFVEQERPSGRYRLAGKTLWVGTGFLRHSAVYQTCFPVLQNLAERAENLVHLAVWDSDAVLYLHTVGHPSSLYLFADAGERRPVHSTALGKVLLAYRPREEMERILASGVERYTESTITETGKMAVELDRVRRQGYAFDDQEGVPGLRCVAAPIRDRRGNVVAAMSISAPSAVLEGAAERRQFASLVSEAALRASVQMGYRPRTSNVASLLVPSPEEAGKSRRRRR